MATSIAELREIVARIGLSLEESDKRRAETERALAESRQEAERSLAESRQETERSLAESRKATERDLAESRKATERVMAEATELHKVLAKTLDDLAKKVDRVTGNVGGLNRSIGEIIQIVVIPGVMGKMNALGHNFTMASIEKEYYKLDGKSSLLEVDLLLENGQEVMAIEVKTSVTENKVERHLNRLKILRRNESNTGIVGKTMYGGIAGLHFSDDARKLAIENGMYLIEIDEDEEKVSVVAPEKVSTW